MAICVCRVAVIGCPRSVIADDVSFKGVGKSCLCNRFVQPETYTEEHKSLLSKDDWVDQPIFNCDHFIYWGAATKCLQDGSKVRFQVVEQTEFYKVANLELLCAHPAHGDYMTRASEVRFASNSTGKIAYRLHADPVRAALGPIRTTELFPNEDFSSKTGPGIYGYVCVFDPTLVGDQMKKQLDYLSELLHTVERRNKKVVIACVKCDAVEEAKIRYGSNLASYVMKKPIPFFEVSAREDVNVAEVFHALIGSPKKRKSVKNGKRSLACCATYKEVVSLQKSDLSRARDAYRKLLQKRVTDFSCVWSDVFPKLEQEPEFCQVLLLGGKEGKEIVKKMFCLRLIELKLIEGSKLHGLSSAKKKANKDQSRAYQDYLSEAFRKHPDLG